MYRLKNILKCLLHKISHLLNMNHGKVTTWFNVEDEIMVGFKCNTCGKVESIHKVLNQYQ